MIQLKVILSFDLLSMQKQKLPSVSKYKEIFYKGLLVKFGTSSSEITVFLNENFARAKQLHSHYLNISLILVSNALIFPYHELHFKYVYES